MSDHSDHHETSSTTVDQASTATHHVVITPATPPAIAPLVHARFRLDEDTRVQIHQRVGDENNAPWKMVKGTRVKMSPVKGEPFGTATPSGSLEMVLANQHAQAMFNNVSLGQEFDVMISPITAVAHQDAKA